MKYFLVLLSILVLAGCGGGSNGIRDLGNKYVNKNGFQLSVEAFGQSDRQFNRVGTYFIQPPSDPRDNIEISNYLSVAKRFLSREGWVEVPPEKAEYEISFTFSYDRGTTKHTSGKTKSGGIVVSSGGIGGVATSGKIDATERAPSNASMELDFINKRASVAKKLKAIDWSVRVNSEQSKGKSVPKHVTFGTMLPFMLDAGLKRIGSTNEKNFTSSRVRFFTASPEEARALYDKVDPTARTEVLLEALENRDLWLVCTFLDNGMDVNLRLKKNRTLLMLATHNHHLAMVQELLRRGAKTDMIDNAGRTAIDFAKDDSFLREIILKQARQSNNVDM